MPMTIIINDRKPVSRGGSYTFTIPRALIENGIINTEKTYRLECYAQEDKNEQSGIDTIESGGIRENGDALDSGSSFN